MGTAAVKMKIMPDSPSVNLEEIKNEAIKIIEKFGGKNVTFTEENIAFGLKAIIPFFAWDEKNDTETVEKALQEIANISSVQTTDVRRAFG